jgi:hypothetical protein
MPVRSIVTDASAREERGFLTRLLRRFAGRSTPRQQRVTPDPCRVAWAVAPDVRASVHDDGVAILHIPTGRVFLCNRTASRIWQGVVDGLSSEDTCDEISREWGVTRALVHQHASSFLSELERRRLVVQRPGAEA